MDGADALCDAYLSAAQDLVRHYANDAELNGYVVDVAAEQATAEAFARSVADGIALCRAAPREDSLNLSWQQVLEAAPEVGPLLVRALRDTP